MYRLRYTTTKFLLFAILALIFFSLSCGNSAAELGKTDAITGKRAHDFTLKDLNGNSVSLVDFRGKKSILLIFTTTWCSRCITIIPELKEIYNKYNSKGLEVIAMYINEAENKVKAFNRKYLLPYAILLDSDGITASAYKIRDIPVLILIDRNSVIRYRGHNVSMDMIKETVSNT
jgi:peroxiredoxin